MLKKVFALAVIILGLGMACISFAEMTGDAAAGKILFEKTCVLCHGKEGKGDGPAAAALNPRLKSYADPAVVAKSDKELFDTITKGRPGTPMVSFEKTLTKQQRWDILAYVRSLGGKK
ncbi:MAG: cytochrome c [Nitrospirae bacterium]|nr:cytochrome c [Nitrospirota bacterium]